MKRVLLPLLLLTLMSSCIDKDYDLKQVQTDNITIGGDGSTFRIPLAQIRITLKEITKRGTDIQALFNEVNIWTPQTLPGGVDYIDLTRLEESAYIEQLTDGLLAQMQIDDKKLLAVSDLMWNSYKTDMLSLLHLPSDTTQAQFTDLFKIAFEQQSILREEARRLATAYLQQINIETISYALDKVDIDPEVVDMLCANLDPESLPAAQRKNTLHLYGEVTSRLPLSLYITPEFQPTTVAFPVEIDALRTTNLIAESTDTQLFETDLRRIVQGVDFNIPFRLEKYYPARGFLDDGQPQVIITLRMIKRGGLQVDL